MAGSGARNGTRRTVVKSLPGSLTVERTAGRIEAERMAVAELEAWRTSVLPDPSAPMDAETLARLVRECYDTLGIDAGVGAGFSVNTVHYYRRKNILDEPAGRTSAARYDVRHLWQAIGARLAGHLGLVTLAEARDGMRGVDAERLVAFVAARVVDARARVRRRQTASRAVIAARPLAVRDHSTNSASAVAARPLPGVLAGDPQPTALEVTSPSVVISLPGDAWCIVPASHPAHRSAGAAREVITALAAALRVPLR